MNSVNSAQTVMRVKVMHSRTRNSNGVLIVERLDFMVPDRVRVRHGHLFAKMGVTIHEEVDGVDVVLVGDHRTVANLKSRMLNCLDLK
jgi:hypothetical protein